MQKVRLQREEPAANTGIVRRAARALLGPHGWRWRSVAGDPDGESSKGTRTRTRSRSVGVGGRGRARASARRPLVGERLQGRDRRGRHAARRPPLHAQPARCARALTDSRTRARARTRTLSSLLRFLAAFETFADSYIQVVHSKESNRSTDSCLLVLVPRSGFTCTRGFSRRTRTLRSAALCSPAGSGEHCLLVFACLARPS